MLYPAAEANGAALAGEVAIVTGASSGIGAATARELARRGASVVLAARRAGLLDAQVQSISEARRGSPRHPRRRVRCLGCPMLAEPHRGGFRPGRRAGEQRRRLLVQAAGVKPA